MAARAAEKVVTPVLCWAEMLPSEFELLPFSQITSKSTPGGRSSQVAWGSSAGSVA